MITAIDGQISGGGGVDKFRIKIWDKNNGDAIVYDNQYGASDTANPTTALGGGSVVIHAALNVSGGPALEETETPMITQADVTPILHEAIARWRAAGLGRHSLKKLSK